MFLLLHSIFQYQNRYRVPMGTKFYRVRAKPWPKDPRLTRENSGQVPSVLGSVVSSPPASLSSTTTSTTTAPSTFDNSGSTASWKKLLCLFLAEDETNPFQEIPWKQCSRFLMLGGTFCFVVALPLPLLSLYLSFSFHTHTHLLQCSVACYLLVSDLCSGYFNCCTDLHIVILKLKIIIIIKSIPYTLTCLFSFISGMKWCNWTEK